MRVSPVTDGLIVMLGAAVAAFGFLALVVLGLALGASVAGLTGAIPLALALAAGWVWLVYRGWRWLRAQRQPVR